MRPDPGRICPHTGDVDDPTSRSLRLLALLQGGRDWSAAALSARLGVSERSVRRDAQRLRDLGYDVHSRPGPGAGYRLRPGVRVPPLLMEPDEVTTLVTSLLVLESWAPDDPGVATVLAKLEQVLPPGLRRRAAATALATQVVRGDGAPVDWSVVGALADAVASGGRVAFDYVDARGARSRRVVQPHRHLLRRSRWYLVGYDVGREDWRLFRLDRVRDLVAVPGAYDSRDFPFASLEAWLVSDFGRA